MLIYPLPIQYPFRNVPMVMLLDGCAWLQCNQHIGSTASMTHSPDQPSLLCSVHNKSNPPSQISITLIAIHLKKPMRDVWLHYRKQLQKSFHVPTAPLFVATITWGYLSLTIDERLRAVRVRPFKRPATCLSQNVLCACAVAKDCTLLTELMDGEAKETAIKSLDSGR